VSEAAAENWGVPRYGNWVPQTGKQLREEWADSEAAKEDYWEFETQKLNNQPFTEKSV
jgi:hypothetical protein